VDLGVVDFVLAMLNGDASAQLPRITAGLVSVDSRSVTIHGESFAAIDQAARDEILRAVEGEDWFASLCELAADGVYADPANGGNRNGAGWRMIGYKHGLPDGPSGPVGSTPAPARLLGMETSEFDVIIVGAGAGGGVAACVLAEAGKKVLLIDRGARRTYLDSGHRDHLRNHRLSVYGHNTGPELDGNPRVCVSQSGLETIVRPNETDYGNNASCLGSGTFLYGGLAWRFHPDDFRMATRYGVPDGSSLTDWPFGYDELEYWYDRAEWEIGVSGDPAGCSHEPWRSRPYPMPPVAETRATHLLRTGADNLGIDTFSVPLLINTAPRQGRAACIECGSCVGFPCPVDAKNGTQNTVVERAIASGNCTLWTDMMVTRIETDDRGKVIGVAAITPAKVGQSNRISIRSKAVVLAAGAVETARLLLMSASAREPEGLGNTRDLVGRNMQAHLYPTVFGLFDDEVHSSRGPGVTLATTAYNHGNPGIIGGAMLADDFVMLPAIFWRSALPPGMRRWGAESKEFMRRNFRHVLQVKGPVHEIPVPTAQVDLARDVRDRFGLPVARLSGSVHNETMRTIDFMTAKARGWLQASGARETWHTPITPRLSVGQHQAGTCRMGSDPATSVTDIFGRVWHHSNLFISDASLHPTNGGFNPVLTVMALAFRNASKIARLI
jgi:choline dehydrogenase-like flavoprotein